MKRTLSYLLLGCLTIPGMAQTISIPYSASSYPGTDGDTKTYFLAAHTGRLQLQLKTRSSQDLSLLVKTDGGSGDTTIRIGAGKEYTTIPAGTFMISDTGYHSISLKRTDGGRSLPEIAELQVSGPAAEGLLFNNSGYRGAPATHLSYPIPGDSAAAWFYSEISVPKDADNSPNAYYMTNGFSGGYMGIQLNSKKERRVIFSVWSNYRTDDPKQIPSEYEVKLVKKGKDVFTGEFGNEGSGGHSHLVFMWKPEQVYKLLINARAAGDHTIYKAWYYAPENREWRLVAEWDKAKTGGKLLSGLYSFVENFGDNGQDYFTARYGNQWICTPSGHWIELTKARFTTTADRVKHPRFDYGGGLSQGWFYMYSGGFRQVNNLPAKSFVTRPALGIPPAIDFSALPDK